MGSHSLSNLCQFASAIHPEELDPSLIFHSRLVLVDTLGAVIAGSSREEISRLLAELPKDEKGSAESSCLGTPERASPLNATPAMKKKIERSFL